MDKVEIFELISKRRSVRRYKPDSIASEDLMTILSAGHTAPSACNKQNWRFIVVNNDELKKKIVDSGGAVFIKNAPVGILVLYDKRTQNVEYYDHIQSGAAAIQNMLLAATSLGIGSCWVCHLPPKRQLRKIFNIPWHMSPIAYIPLGYPLNEPSDRPRKCSIENLISYNEFQLTEEVPRRSPALIMRIILIKIYYLLPEKIKKTLFPFVDKKFVTKFE